jgi:hypothetical protein
MAEMKWASGRPFLPPPPYLDVALLRGSHSRAYCALSQPRFLGEKTVAYADPVRRLPLQARVHADTINSGTGDVSMGGSNWVPQPRLGQSLRRGTALAIAIAVMIGMAAILALFG